MCTSIVNLFFSIYLFSLEKEGQPTTAKEFILIFERLITHAQLGGGREILEWPTFEKHAQKFDHVTIM